MGLGRLGALAVGLAVWYSLNETPKNSLPSSQKYSLPKEIKVVETTLPYITREKVTQVSDPYGTPYKKIELEKIVDTETIDFSKDFKIKTDRYRIVKDDDWWLSRAIGTIGSLPTKLFFWDCDMGKGLDSERSRSVLAMLENDKSISNLTVRVNHTEAFYDWYRMMTDKKLRERNPFLYRAIFGSLTTFGGELFAELSRGNYYNPLTKTVVTYSNVESIPAHEFGHHKDFERFSTDWVYSLGRALPPVMLYQEWKASSNARKIMSKEDDWQFNRYLLPAFFTYVLATVGSIARVIKKMNE